MINILSNKDYTKAQSSFLSVRCESYLQQIHERLKDAESK